MWIRLLEKLHGGWPVDGIGEIERVRAGAPIALAEAGS